MLRLDKYLADMGIGTRQEVKKYIRQGRISVDDQMVKKCDLKIDEKLQIVTFDKQRIIYETFEYFMLNKPAGVISATEDKNAETVIDLIADAKRKDLFPVGRLDKDTEGLLLITNDGQLAHHLLSPKHHVDKVYFAKILGLVSDDDIKQFQKGLNIGTKEEPEWTKPGVLNILKSDEISEIRLTIQEGKYHQVKRMFQAVGKEVLYLKRESMGTLELDPILKPGEYRKLTEEEIKNL